MTTRRELSRDDLYLTNAGKAEEGSLGSWHGLVAGTIHPSAVLRGPDLGSQDRAYAGLVSDFVLARETAARQ